MLNVTQNLQHKGTYHITDTPFHYGFKTLCHDETLTFPINFPYSFEVVKGSQKATSQHSVQINHCSTAAHAHTMTTSQAWATWFLDLLLAFLMKMRSLRETGPQLGIKLWLLQGNQSHTAEQSATLKRLLGK